MDENRPMDAEYAALSAFVGLFAGIADGFLGGSHFRTKLREQAWDLTVEKLAQWKMEALRMGVPEAELELTADELALMPSLLELGMKLQEQIDKLIWSQGQRDTNR